MNTIYAGAVSSEIGTEPSATGTTGTEPSATDTSATASTENGISNIGTESVTITDTTVSDASTLITLNNNTTGVITASSVSEITGTASELNTLLTAGNDIEQFSGNSFSSLTTATVSDSTLSVDDLNGAINATTSTVFSLSAGATINCSSTEGESAFTTLLAYERAERLEISDQNITVDPGITVSVDNANLLNDTTTGTVTATIALSEVSHLIQLRGTNAYTITIALEDAAVSASDLNELNALTTEAVDLTNVSSITSSSLEDLGTLATAIGDSEFINAGGLITIAVSDTTIDATTLASTIDSYDTINGVSGVTDMTLAGGATIEVDAGEITEMLADESAGKLTICLLYTSPSPRD